jgi:hypothetical protein
MKEIRAKKYLAYKEVIKRCTRSDVEKHNELRRTEKRVHNDMNKRFYKHQLMKIEDINQLKGSRKFYKLINELRKGFRLRI